MSESSPVPAIAESSPGVPAVLPPDTDYESLPKVEWEKMIAGGSYKGSDPYINYRQRHGRKVMRQLDALDMEDRVDFVRDVFTHETGDARVWVRDGFRCEYGSNIHVSGFVFINFNVTILDLAPVHIGNMTGLAPNVVITTVSHPSNPAQRYVECLTAPIRIGNNCIIGANAVVLPGITIGDDCFVAAGTVVHRDVEAGCIVAGSPMRVVRRYPKGAGVGCKGVKVSPGMSDEEVRQLVEVMSLGMGGSSDQGEAEEVGETGKC